MEGLAARRTVGQFIRDLLFNTKYFGTMLPPIPVPVMKTIEETVRKFDEEVAQEAEEAAPVERASRPRGGNDDDDDDDGVRPRRRECVVGARSAAIGLGPPANVGWHARSVSVPTFHSQVAAGPAGREPKPGAVSVPRVFARPGARAGPFPGPQLLRSRTRTRLF